jgi:hypothetical protein
MVTFENVSHRVAWMGTVSDLEGQFVCKACGKKRADVRPDFNWNKKTVAAMGYR